MLTWKGRTTAMRVRASGAAVLALLSGAASASIWTGGNGGWSSNGNPGWNGTGTPNAVGATAWFSSGVVGTTTVDIAGGVTIGTLEIGGTGNTQRSITLTNSITFNQDGAGSGYAVIRNSDTNSGTGSRLSISTGTLTLADDLRIENTGSSTNASGAITITSNLLGAGNLTISNVSNNYNAGRINLTGVSSFTGNVLIEKGVVGVGGNGNPFGATANVMTLGSVGNGSASVLSNGSSTAVPNDIVVAAGTGGTLLLGSVEAGTATSSYSGRITLNGDLSVTSSKTGAGTLAFTNTISGAGSLTKLGSGAVTLTKSSVYTGTTTVAEGTLILSGSGSIMHSPVIDVKGGATLNVAGVTGGFTLMGGQALKGTGTVAGAMTVAGSLAPGNSIGTMSTGNLTLSTGTLDVELGRSGATPVSDRVDVVGTVTLASADLNLSLYTGLGNPQDGDIFYLVNNDGSDAVSGVFTRLNGATTTLDEGSTFMWNSQSWKITYQADVGGASFIGGNDIALQVVPEPAALTLLGLGGILFIRRRKG